MANVPAKVAKRIPEALRRFQPVLENARARDVNESDTVTIIADMLSDVFGYDKYAEVTSEYAIRGTYVDLAIKLDGKIHLLIEVKAVNAALDDRHTKQAVDYAANEGAEWVVLTNGVRWKTYRITFGKPIGSEVVMDVDLLTLNPRTSASVDALFPLTREGVIKSALQLHHEQKQATNRFIVGAVMQSEPVLNVLRRELRRLNPNVKIETDELRQILVQEVLKRDVVESEQTTQARAKMKRASNKRLRIRSPAESEQSTPDADEAPASPALNS